MKVILFSHNLLPLTGKQTGKPWVSYYEANISVHKAGMDLSWFLSSSEVNEIHSRRFERFAGRNNFENGLMLFTIADQILLNS